MTFDANVKKLGDLMRLDSGFPFKSSEWIDSGIPVIKIRNVQDGFVDLTNCSFVSETTANKAKDWYGQIGNTLIALTGAGVGEIGRIHKKQSGLINQRVGWVRPKMQEDEDYIYYLLRYLKNQIIELASGSAQPNVSPRDILNIPCQVPIEIERRVIGNLLKTLDDKLELSKRLTKNLEDIAQTLFKSWFIDFDPVKAKMNGEKPMGMDDETAALFPDSFEESELGLIPKGWEVGSLGDLYDLQGGFAFKSSSWTETGVPVIKIGSVKPGFIDFEQVSFVSKEFANEIPDDYRLPAGSLVVGLTGYVGEVGLARNHFPVPLVNQRVAKFKSKSGDWKLPYIYCLTRNPKFKSTVEELSTGTAQQNVSNSQILSIPIVKPTKKVFTHFEDMLESYFKQIINLADENETLKTLRDSLLPRLISGELQIPKEMLVS